MSDFTTLLKSQHHNHFEGNQTCPKFFTHWTHLPRMCFLPLTSRENLPSLLKLKGNKRILCLLAYKSNKMINGFFPNWCQNMSASFTFFPSRSREHPFWSTKRQETLAGLRLECLRAKVPKRCRRLTTTWDGCSLAKHKGLWLHYLATDSLICLKHWTKVPDRTLPVLAPTVKNVAALTWHIVLRD